MPIFHFVVARAPSVVNFPSPSPFSGSFVRSFSTEWEIAYLFFAPIPLRRRFTKAFEELRNQGYDPTRSAAALMPIIRGADVEQTVKVSGGGKEEGGSESEKADGEVRQRLVLVLLVIR
jgi:hypothetical protein